MKNKYAALEKDYHFTISRLSDVTGWPAEQAETVVDLVVQAAEKRALTVTEKKYQDVKNAKYLATKKLLQNYRRLREAISLGTEHALKLLEDTEYQRLMDAEESLQSQKVQSVALIAAANRVLWARMNTALDCFKDICGRASRGSERRGYELIYWRYLGTQAMPVDQIAEKYHIEQAQFFRDIREAINTISVLLFGVGNTEDFLFSAENGKSE